VQDEADDNDTSNPSATLQDANELQVPGPYKRQSRSDSTNSHHSNPMKLRQTTDERDSDDHTKRKLSSSGNHQEQRTAYNDIFQSEAEDEDNHIPLHQQGSSSDANEEMTLYEKRSL